jgi:hypothetical protein
MLKQQKRWLESGRRSSATRAGRALVAWLNQSRFSKKFIEDLLEEAKVVFQHLEKYGDSHEFYVAAKDKEIPGHFWECYESLSEKLSKFTKVPSIDLHEAFEENPITWTITEIPSVALVGSELGWILELIDQNAVNKIRRCKQCAKWYFARVSQQEFCSSLCRGKAHAQTEPFKERRRSYMRDYYRLQQSGKVK